MGTIIFFLLTFLSIQNSLGLDEESSTQIGSNQSNPEEEKVAAFLVEAEEELRKTAEKASFIEWAYETNITDENEKKKTNFQEKVDALKVKVGNEAKKFNKTQIKDQVLIRKLNWLTNLGTSALSPEKLKRYHKNNNNMNSIYSTAKVTSYKNPKILLSLDPDLTDILASSRDAKELEYYWNEWRKATGQRMREDFIKNIDLTNEAAILNGYKDGTELKVVHYESDTFVKEMEDTWNGIKPLYEQLHAYTRAKLLKLYGNDIIDPTGPIPAHLMGNMWAQAWVNLAPIIKPYPNKQSIDVTQAMKDQGWTPKIMFQKADEFFISLGLDPMPEEFWNGSLIEKPDDGRDLVCHPTAWDFYNGKDFRIKMCTTVTNEKFRTVNHEMGHIQYQRSYRNQSFLFREGANPGFHEGVADVLSLAVGTATYNKRLGLIDNSTDITDEETDINILFEMALEKLAIMPFAYIVDKYRWDLYSGIASPDKLNCHWVQLVADIQGFAPPSKRDESHFDAGSKYHVAANFDYVQYFTANIYQFQFYKALCKVSGQYEPGDNTKPLHRCNFYGSKEAGAKLFEMLRLGKSKPWKEIMEIMTGTPGMDTGAYREYFAPLEKWLIQKNKEENNPVGWNVKDFSKLCSKSTSFSFQFNPEEEKVVTFLVEAEEELRKNAEQSTYIEWAYETNITEENEEKKTEFQEKVDALNVKIGNEAKKFNKTQIKDQDLVRKLQWLTNVGTSALSPEKLKRYHKNNNNLEKIYITAKVPSYKNPKILLSLEPDLTDILSSSRDAKELEYYWREWRKATGVRMRKYFIENIDLTNEAARLNGYKDGTELKLIAYESDNFVKEMEDTWNGLKPLYEQLHAYARAKLLKQYGNEIIDPTGPIPTHLMGNMWAQKWNNLATILRPYPNKPSIDVTQAMKDQGWTPKIIFQKADEFFTSLGLDSMPEEFWNSSLIEKPDDGRDVVCHPSAWDFYNGKDFRIKHCARGRKEDMFTAHHFMGEIQYQRSYRNQSFLFREVANPGFNDGVGGIFPLAVGTGAFFKRLGLINNSVDITDEETDINILFDMALKKIAFLPFGYLVDKYRWDLYSGIASPDELNCHWVKLVADVQGLAPPSQRDESQFDAGSKYHVSANIDYVQFFTAHIYEFQFYQTLCKVSGQYVPGDSTKPLHRCNFYGSKEAGAKLIEMLRLGKSKPWKEIMEIMTGTPGMDTGAFREYFAPLEKWLIQKNKEENNPVGWTVKDYSKLCSNSTS